MATSVTLREMRARLLHEALLAHPELVERVEDIARLPRVSRWTPLARDVAIADLAGEGLITEAADGRLCVRPRGRLL